MSRGKVNPDQIGPGTSFADDLGADSLDSIEMAMDVEEAFDITVPDEDIDTLATVGDAIRYVEAKVGEV